MKGDMLFELKVNSKSIYHLSWSPDDKYIAFDDGKLVSVAIIPNMSTSSKKRGAQNQSQKTDKIVMKNGDKITGKLLNDPILLQTSYATLNIPRSKVQEIIFEGNGKKLDRIFLTNGDKLSGIVKTSSFKIKLKIGPNATMSKDKIQQISLSISSGIAP
jgi:sRNA-binding regulator protein Hfq